jgi:hypothetical protein
MTAAQLCPERIGADSRRGVIWGSIRLPDLPAPLIPAQSPTDV